MQREEGPSWLALTGEERLDEELRALRRDVKAGKLPGVTKVSLPDDDLRCWRIKVEWLDPLTQTGMQFNAEMDGVKRKRGAGHASLQLEACFGESYPAEPFSLRIVRPRVPLFTVHVTEGGSVCIEALASCEGDGGWKPSRTLCGILQQLLRDFVLPDQLPQDGGCVNADAAPQRQWPLWPLRVHTELGPLAFEGYSPLEAQHAFRRAAWQNGWAPAPPAVPAAAAAAAADACLAMLPAVPSHWELSDALLAGQAVYVELPLPGQAGQPGSAGQGAALREAEHVLQLFNAQPHPNSRVLRVERVQNLGLWRRYCRRREMVERESGLPDVQLFHGTNKEAAELICRSGFDVRLASAQGSLGAGLYFGSASAISAQFCTRAFNPEAVQALGHQPAEPGLLGAAAPGGGPRFQYNGYAMLLCRVAVGTAGTGSRGARAPQPGCHSAEGNGTMHVVYQSDQAYPEYIIHFIVTAAGI